MGATNYKTFYPYPKTTPLATKTFVGRSAVAPKKRERFGWTPSQDYETKSMCSENSLIPKETVDHAGAEHPMGLAEL